MPAQNAAQNGCGAVAVAPASDERVERRLLKLCRAEPGMHCGAVRVHDEAIHLTQRTQVSAWRYSIMCPMWKGVWAYGRMGVWAYGRRAGRW